MQIVALAEPTPPAINAEQTKILPKANWPMVTSTSTPVHTTLTDVIRHRHRLSLLLEIPGHHDDLDFPLERRPERRIGSERNRFVGIVAG